MLLESRGGGLNQPAPSRSPQNNFFFDFLKVHNELGKVKKFWTFRPIFAGRNLKKVWAQCAPPAPLKSQFLSKYDYGRVNYHEGISK